MANDIIINKRPGDDVSAVTTAAVVGKRCLQITAARPGGGLKGLSSVPDTLYRVGHPNAGGGALGAGKRVFGVAKYDAASGKRVGVCREGIVSVTCSANVTAGQEVEVAANGTVIPVASGVAIGLAVDTATNGADSEICLYNG